MKIEEIDPWENYLYQKKCDLCENIINIRTQDNNNPEYHTNIYVQCNCKNWVEFELPVN